jgi:formylglycine-generating enzyme required for sulfatase activity
MPNFADTSRGPRNFSNAYHALHRFTRRPGPESDAYVFKPMEYHSSTSELVQMLKKGHHGVELDEEAWRRLHCWIDLNVPYFGSWTEIVEAGKERGTGQHVKNVSDRYVELKKLYADNDLNFETDAYYYDEAKKNRPAFVAPKEQPELDRSAPQIANWPFDAAKAKAMQSAATAANDAAKDGGDYAVSVVSSQKATVALEEGLTFEMARIPAGSFAMGDENGFADEFPRAAVTIEKPFWMATTETTNAMYKLFDESHDSRYIDQQHKDHVLPGYPANLPNQPVIRVSQAQATAFCAWLSEKTGKKFRLPTEAEWEWAARAGSATSAWYGDGDADFGKFENLSDVTTKRFVVQGVNPQPVANPADWLAFIPRVDNVNDGQMIATEVGSYAPNPWGLYDMIGNVSEWTSSDYKPYPYNAADGRESGSAEAKKVARGGSWNDRPKWARSGVRRDYESWQPVHNVGFRVVCEDDLAK